MLVYKKNKRLYKSNKIGYTLFDTMLNELVQDDLSLQRADEF